MYVFVYGTLKQGHRNHDGYLNVPGVEFLGKAQTRDASFLMQAYNSATSPGKQTPGVWQTGTAHISGELYKVTPEVLAQLDILEEVSSKKYDRVTVDLLDGQQAFMYVHTEEYRTPLPQSDHLRLDNDIYEWVA